MVVQMSDTTFAYVRGWEQAEKGGPKQAYPPDIDTPQERELWDEGFDDFVEAKKSHEQE